MKTWRWEARDDIPYQTDLRGYKFSNDYFSLSPDGYALVKAGYACDGITPHVRLGRFGYLGLPEGLIQKDTMLPETHRPFFIHDALNQYKEEIRLTRAQTGPVFCEEIMKTEFPLRRVYCGGVKLYGMVRR